MTQLILIIDQKATHKIRQTTWENQHSKDFPQTPTPDVQCTHLQLTWIVGKWTFNMWKTTTDLQVEYHWNDGKVQSTRSTAPSALLNNYMDGTTFKQNWNKK